MTPASGAAQLHNQSKDKSHRGAASQFFVAGELCRRGLVAVITIGNCPNTDILVSNKAGTKFAHVQVKTFRPGVDKTVTVGMKAERNYGPDFFWILSGIPGAGSEHPFEYFIIPAEKFSRLVTDDHVLWLKAPGAKGQAHNPTKVRTVAIPPRVMRYTNESIDKYKDCWELIEERCRDHDVSPALQRVREEELYDELT